MASKEQFVRRSLPELRLKGSHAEVGFEIGRIFRGLIEDVLKTHKNLHSCLLPFYNTERGKEFVTGLQEAFQRTFPQYHDELEAIATGAKVPHIQLFLIHVETEILIFISENGEEAPEDSCTACSTVLVNSSNLKALAHNEDSELMNKTGYILHVEIPPQNGRKGECFTAYTYPGILPGSCFGFNSKLSFSHNALKQNHTEPGGIGRRLFHRIILASSSIDEVVEAALNLDKGLACATHLNLVEYSQNAVSRMVSLELAAGSDGTIHNVHDVTVGHYCHSNHLRVLKEANSPNQSSIERLKRMLEMVEPTTEQDLASYLGDRDNERWPIFRDNRSLDDRGITGASCIINFETSKLKIYISNPIDNNCAKEIALHSDIQSR